MLNVSPLIQKQINEVGKGCQAHLMLMSSHLIMQSGRKFASNVYGLHKNHESILSADRIEVVWCKFIKCLNDNIPAGHHSCMEWRDMQYGMAL